MVSMEAREVETDRRRQGYCYNLVLHEVYLVHLDISLQHATKTQRGGRV